MFLWPLRLALKIFGAVVLAIVLYLAVTLVQVWLTSRQNDPQPAGAIVVMGAAQYDGVPSPDQAARLNEAVTLYHEGMAHLVVATGSKEKGDQFTEAQAGARYLEYKGIPATDVLEAGGSDSYQNLVDAAAILKPRKVTTILIATDPFHEHRCLSIATEVGLTAYPTPTRTSPISGFSTVPYFVKEAVAVGIGRIIGYQHLSQLHADLGELGIPDLRWVR
jgi:uncharacterized SAM-binding protein YcdF (DUF218 family)